MLELCLGLDSEEVVFLFFVGVEFIDVLELGFVFRRLGALSVAVLSPFFCFEFEASATLFFGDDFIVVVLLVTFLGEVFDASDGSFFLFRAVPGDFVLGLCSFFLLGVCCFGDAADPFNLPGVPRLLVAGLLADSLKDSYAYLTIESHRYK